MDFEEQLKIELDKLPYKKHVDDGQYNDGQLDGFELGARWAFALGNIGKCDHSEWNNFKNDEGNIACSGCKKELF
jgi:hypothetical protein